ncbi:MAG TPA: hypothetical protein VLT90_13310 [Terriglobales bacterium]|nr:hypothetical protein [Terriglobales bacterium]
MKKTVPRPEDKDGKQRLWKSLNDAGLVGIELDEFPERIREVKQAVMVRLGELLEDETDWRERESAAYSLGTLKKLESKLQARAAKQDG